MKHGVPVRGVYPKQQIELMRRVGRNFGVNIQTLSGEGERYKIERNLHSGSGSYEGNVPAGNEYIQIGDFYQNLDEFWKGFRELSSQRS